MNCWQNEKIGFPEYFSAITLSKIAAGTKGGPRPKVIILGVSNGVLPLCFSPKRCSVAPKCLRPLQQRQNHKDLPDLVTLLTFNPSKSRGYNIALDVLKNDILTLLKFTSKEKCKALCVVNNIHAVEIFKILILKK
jgi:hypothetical protein